MTHRSGVYSTRQRVVTSALRAPLISEREAADGGSLLLALAGAAQGTRQAYTGWLLQAFSPTLNVKIPSNEWN